MNSTIFDNVFDTKVSDTSADGRAHRHRCTHDEHLHGRHGRRSNHRLLHRDKHLGERRASALGSARCCSPAAIRRAPSFAGALDTRVAIDGGSLIDTGKLANMKLAEDEAFDIAPGDSVKVRIDVYVKDSAAFLAAGLDKSEVTADYLFNSIAK